VKPHPKVSAAKYRETAAKVMWRIKGNPDGPIYEGQKVITPCKSCSKPK